MAFAFGNGSNSRDVPSRMMPLRRAAVVGLTVTALVGGAVVTNANQFRRASRVEDLAAPGPLTPEVRAAIAAAGESVALLLVGYALHDQISGKPLRFASVDPSGRPQAGPDGIYKASVSGCGPVVTSYTIGTAVLVEDDRLLTHRNVVEPWREAPTRPVTAGAFTPRRTLAHAYFQGSPRPVDVQVLSVVAVADIAVLSASVAQDRRRMRLTQSNRGLSPGDSVIVIGYPTRFEGLLAQADISVASEIIHHASASPPALARALASRNLIVPSVDIGQVGTVGHTITSLAGVPSQFGSSGSPVLSFTGELIALTYAGSRQFAGEHDAIPVGGIVQLLEAIESKTR